MTHAERKARRMAMAEAVRAGADLADVCRQYGVTVTTVTQALREAGVQSPVVKVPSGSSFAIIAKLATTDDTLAAIAQAHGLTKTRVWQIYAKCRQYGVPVRERPRGGPRPTRLVTEGQGG